MNQPAWPPRLNNRLRGARFSPAWTVLICALLLCVITTLGAILGARAQQKLRTGVRATSGTVVFRFEFGGGGVGDCLKGMVAAMQIAALAGCDFRVDFSRHPFDGLLPLVPGVAADAYSRGLPGDSVNVYHMGDWISSPQRRDRRDALLLALSSGALSQSGAVTVIQANLAMTRELSVALQMSTAETAGVATRAMAGIYERVIDGAALGTYWPAGTESNFRVAVHLREGDQFIAHATFNKNDVRVGDRAALSKAIASIPAAVVALNTGTKPINAFVCGDTAGARQLLRSALESHFLIIESPETPVHIGYAAFVEAAANSTDAMRVARDTFREHQTLASADVLFMLSHSGFSITACAAAAAGGRPLASIPRCFVRAGGGHEWVEYDATPFVFFSPRDPGPYHVTAAR
jgi:hypothetical protein